MYIYIHTYIHTYTHLSNDSIVYSLCLTIYSITAKRQNNML